MIRLRAKITVYAEDNILKPTTSDGCDRFSPPEISFLENIRAALNNGMTTWGWEVDTALIGRPQSRRMLIDVSATCSIPVCSRTSAIRILDVCLPGDMGYSLQLDMVDAAISAGYFHIVNSD